MCGTDKTIFFRQKQLMSTCIYDRHIYDRHAKAKTSILKSKPQSLPSVLEVAPTCNPNTDTKYKIHFLT